MRLVYMDEAGISRNEPFCAVGGVVVHGDQQLLGVQRHLDSLVKEWIPEPKRAGFVFHATELFHARGKTITRDEWPLERRFELAEALAAIPKRHGLRLALGVEERARHEGRTSGWDKATEAQRSTFLHASAFSGCVVGVDQWLRKEHPDEVCMLVVEDNDQARKTIRDVVRFQQKKDTTFGKGSTFERFFPLKGIVEDPLFSPKKPSSVLQLADFWSYIAKKTYEGDARYRRFAEMLRPSLLPGVFPEGQFG